MSTINDAKSFAELFLTEGHLTAVRNDLASFKEELRTAQFADSDFNNVLDWALLLLQKNMQRIFFNSAPQVNADMQVWRRQNWTAEAYMVFLSRPQRNSNRKTVHSALHVLSILTMFSQQRGIIEPLLSSLKCSEQFKRFLTAKVEEPFCLWYIDAALDALSNSSYEVLEGFLNAITMKISVAKCSRAGDVSTCTKSLAEAGLMTENPNECEASSSRNLVLDSQALFPLGRESEATMNKLDAPMTGSPDVQCRDSPVQIPELPTTEGTLNNGEAKTPPAAQQNNVIEDPVRIHRLRSNEQDSHEESTAVMHNGTFSRKPKVDVYPSDVIRVPHYPFMNEMLPAVLEKSPQTNASKTICHNDSSDQLIYLTAVIPDGNSIKLFANGEQQTRLLELPVKMQRTRQQPVWLACAGNEQCLLRHQREIYDDILNIVLSTSDFKYDAFIKRVTADNEDESSNGDCIVVIKTHDGDLQRIHRVPVDFVPDTSKQHISASSKWCEASFRSALKKFPAMARVTMKICWPTTYGHARKESPSYWPKRIEPLDTNIRVTFVYLVLCYMSQAGYIRARTEKYGPSWN